MTEAWSSVAQAWADNAPHVEAMKEPVTAALLGAIKPQPGSVLLDVGAGPGELARLLAERVGPEGRVFASDVADGMVAVMRDRLADLPNVDVRTCDASATGLPDGEADGVIARMSLMFSEQPETAVAEAFRVLKPGGAYAAATWGGPLENMWMAAVGMAAGMNGLIHGPGPMAPGMPFSLSEGKQLQVLLEDAGFTDVEVTEVPVEVGFTDEDAHFEHVAALAGPLSVALREAPAETLAAVRRTAADAVAAFKGPEGLVIPGLALVATGTRP